MNKLLTDQTGGFDFFLDDLRYLDNALRDALTNVLRAFGDNFIIQGCDVVGANISAGYLMLNGEVIKVDAHAKTGDYYSTSITYDPAGLKTFKNGQAHNTYEKKRAVCDSGAGLLRYDGAKLFGNRAGSICEGNDARLSNSRQCNNTFDDATTARTNIDVFSKAETLQKIADLVASAPATLDTLNELAAALGDDPNFATTITNLIATKANSSDVYTKTEVNAFRIQDLGDPASFDFQLSDLNVTTGYHNLNLSSFIPIGSKAVLLRVRVASDQIGDGIYFRKPGNSNAWNITPCFILVVNQIHNLDIIVFVSDDREISYNVSGINLLTISVAGYL
jgi:hypothetical protein